MYFDVIFGESERNRIQIHSVRTRLKERKRHGLGELNFIFIRLSEAKSADNTSRIDKDFNKVYTAVKLSESGSTYSHSAIR